MTVTRTRRTLPALALALLIAVPARADTAPPSVKKEAKDGSDAKESKEAKEAKETKETKDAKDDKEAKEAAAKEAESPPVPLAEAVRGLKGRGALQAKIDVEWTGTPPIKGTFTCTLFEDKTPTTVANFVALARGLRRWKDPRSGTWVKKPLYDGTTLHRAIPTFMLQGGDPEGTGRGGPGYYFDDEIKSDLVFDKGGLLAMANKGIDRATGHGTNGSQFFITEKETPWLNGRHAIFGHCEPLDLEVQLALVPTSGPPAHRPLKEIAIKKVTIQRAKK